MRFTGKTAVVTGAGSGIGRAVARRLLEEGAAVVLAGRTLEKLEAVARGFPRGRAVCVAARHEEPTGAGRIVDAARRELGRLDILVNNAGVFTPGSAGDTSLEAWNESLAVNVTGPFLLTRESLPLLREARGAVVNVASGLGLKAIPGAAAYSAAKAALIQLTRTTALEEGRRGVRVNVVCPGMVETPMLIERAGAGGEDPAQFLGKAGALHPLGRVGQPEEVASAVLFLASGESGWTTGAVVTIDGGISVA